MTREQANNELIHELIQLVNKHPDLRFGQILQNFNFVETKEVNETVDSGRKSFSLYWKDEFYLESTDLLKRVVEGD